MPIWKPTAKECRLIRTMAKQECKRLRLRMEPGIRYNTETDRGRSMNIAAITDDPEWNDTDLHDMASWADFVRGVELTSDGRAIVDFYCYSLGDFGELESNIDVTYAGGRIVRIYGTGEGIMHEATP